MSEQIKELAKQAKTETNGHFEGPAFDWNDWHSHFNKKFAELIVRECANVLDAFNNKHMVDEGMRGEHMKKHFGVE